MIFLESPVSKSYSPPPPTAQLTSFGSDSLSWFQGHSTEVTDDNLMVTLGLEKILNLQREILSDSSVVQINGVGNL